MNRKNKIGIAILTTALLLSFLSAFPTMWYMNSNMWPRIPSRWWGVSATLAILFPILATHFHAICLNKKFSWLSVWLSISNLMIVSIWVYSRFRGTQNFEEADVVTWFFSAVVGGSLGGFIVFGIIRRIAPGWLGCEKLELSVQRKFSLKKMFYWLTSIALICGAIVNAESLHLTIWERGVPLLLVWVLVAILVAIMGCLFVFLPSTIWLRTAKPAWMSAMSLAVVPTLVLTVILVIGTIATVAYSNRETLHSMVSISGMFACGMVLGIWIFGCRLAGLVDAKPTIRKPRFQWLARIGWCCKQLGFAITVVVLIFPVGWLIVHFGLGGSERDYSKTIKESIARSFSESAQSENDSVKTAGGMQVDEDWTRIVNRNWKRGVTKDNNLAIKLLKVVNPFPQDDPDFVQYCDELGLSEQERLSLPVYDAHDWFNKRHQPYPERELAVVVYERMDFYRYLNSTPWTGADYPPGAEFIEAHASQINELKSISKTKTIYSPLVQTETHPRQHGLNLLSSARFLLSISAMYHTGRGEVDEAIEDCEALFRLADPKAAGRIRSVADLARCRFSRQADAKRLAVTIALSGHASVDQMKRLLVMSLDLQETDEFDDFDKRLFAAFQKESVLNKLGEEKLELVPNPFDGPYVFVQLFKSYPSTVDWTAFNSAFNDILNSHTSAMFEAKLEKIDLQTLRTRTLENFTRKGTSTSKDVYHAPFGNQLITWVRGPKTKGDVLGKMMAASSLHTRPEYVLYSLSESRMNEIALALEIYLQTNGQYPDKLGMLVPGVIDVVPNNPHSNGPFKYLPTKSGFELFATRSEFFATFGQDRRDNIELQYERPPKNLLELLSDDK